MEIIHKLINEILLMQFADKAKAKTPLNQIKSAYGKENTVC